MAPDASSAPGSFSGDMRRPLANGLSCHTDMEAERSNCWRPGVTAAEQLANQPRSRHGELIPSLFLACIIAGVTGWILVAMVVPINQLDKVYSWYSILLTVLGSFALFASLYIFQIGWGAFHWTRRYRSTKDTDWYNEWAGFKADANAAARHTAGNLAADVVHGGSGTSISPVVLQPPVLEWDSIQHFVVVTNYKEPIEVLRLVAYTLMSQRVEGFCRDQITLVLAFEEREGPPARAKAEALTTELRPFFRDVLSTYHPPDLHGDIKGKASNYKWAVKEAERYIRAGRGNAAGLIENSCLIHVADADSLYDPNHFPYITYVFSTREDRHDLVFQPCMIPTCNIWDIPPPCRQLSTMVAAQEMMSANDPREFQVPFSTYGLSLKTLQLVGGTGNAADAQDGDVIAEDHHLFIKAFFATEGRIKVEPVYLPCLNFSVGGAPKSLWSNLYDRFVQAKRHMFGVSELVYFLALVARCLSGRWRIRLGLRGWTRTLCLFYKLVKIHSANWLGFWVTLGLVFVFVLKLNKNYCEAHISSMPNMNCNSALTHTTETNGAVIFSVTTGLSVLGSMFVIVAFVRMLRATQHTLTNIADPNGSFMGPEVWSQGRQRRSSAQQSEWLRRPMEVGTGYPWCGAVTQLMMEFVVFGFITSVVYGTIPCVIAVWHLICRGHRLEYVAAHGAGRTEMDTPSGTVEERQVPKDSTLSVEPRQSEAVGGG